MEHSAMSLYWPESREEDLINVAVVARIKPVRHNDKSQTARPYPLSLSFSNLYSSLDPGHRNVVYCCYTRHQMRLLPVLLQILQRKVHFLHFIISLHLSNPPDVPVFRGRKRDAADSCKVLKRRNRLTTCAKIRTVCDFTRSHPVLRDSFE
jgi:hypothetical protein